MRVKKEIHKILNKLKRVVKEPVYIPVLDGKILEGKTVLITGATGGIGMAIAKRCAENSAVVIIAGRNQNKISKVVNSLNNAVPFVMDIQNIENMKQAFLDLVEDKKLKIDTLINCAGLQAGGVFGSTDSMGFDKTLNTNLKGTYFLSQIFSNYLIENNIKGNILNISSVSGCRPAISPYMVSKWGITGLTAGMAKKLIKYGIVVNGIAPGPVATGMMGLDGLNLDYDKAPAGRYSDPIEIANLAVFMVSSMGRMIVGDTVYISGGCGNLTFDDIEY